MTSKIKRNIRNEEKEYESVYIQIRQVATIVYTIRAATHLSNID